MNRWELKRLRATTMAIGACCVSALVLAAGASAQKVDGVPSKTATAPVNLQLTPTDAFVRIRGWSLPAPILPLALLGSWGGKGTVSGAGAVNIPQGQISTPQQFQFPRDINGEEEQMIVSLSSRSDWNGVVDPLDGDVQMNMPMNLRIEANHVRMVDLPWPAGWIYGNIDCTVPFDFAPMTTAKMDPPDPAADPPPATEGTPYSPATGEFSVINNSMTVGGFDCSHPTVGGGKVEDELNEAVAIPSPAGRLDARFNMTFLEGGNILRPQPAIRPAFTAAQGAALTAELDATSSFAKAGVMRYAWDLDGDGAQDTTTGSPSASKSFPTAGSYPVGLRIVDKDGDVSAWTSQTVTVSEQAAPAPPGPPAGLAKMAPLKIKPKKRKARSGKKATFRVRVKNTGSATSAAVKLCVKGPKRLVRVPKCRKLGKLEPGQAKTAKLKVKVKRRAATGKRLRLRFRALAGAGVRASGKARIRVVRKRSGRR